MPEYNPECHLCPKLCENTLNVCMESDGPENAEIMVVGEAPGEFEDDLNRPFSGSSGELLRDNLLVDAGIPESAVRFAYAVRCCPENSRAPTVLEIRKCREYLIQEILRIKPCVIIGLGNVALATILQFFYKGAEEEGAAKKSTAKVSGILQWRGKLIWLKEFSCWFVPTLTPYMVNRDLSKWSSSIYTYNQVVSDLKLAWNARNRGGPSQYPRSVYVTDVNRARCVISKMQESPSGMYAYDIETGGTGKTTNRRIIGASFACDGKVGYYIPWHVFQSSSVLLHELYALLAGPVTKIIHNAAFETRIHRLSQTRTPWRSNYVDTMIAASLVDENFSKRLKDLAWLYTPMGGYDIPVEKYKFEMARKNKAIKEDYSLIPEDLLGVYGGYDAVVTYILYGKLKKAMERENVFQVFSKISMPLRRVLSNAEYTGLYMDRNRAEELDSLCTIARERLDQKIYEAAGCEFNIASPKQLQKILYEDLGFQSLKKTKTGESTDADSLQFIATQTNNPNYSIARFLLDRSYLKTMHTTHIQQALTYQWDDARVHTNYNSTGTVTGRISASMPSLQNVPNDRLIRSLYRATPGNILIEADLKSAELAVIAAVSGEKTLVSALMQGMDPHAATYRRMYNLSDACEVTKQQRRVAKTVNFGMVYGITPSGLSSQLGITLEEATEFIELYFQKMPHVANWLDEQKTRVHTTGYVSSIFGRKRRLPLGMSDKLGDISRAERQAMNAPIQSGAADYAAIGMSRLSRSIRNEKMKTQIVHTVHDCVITDGPSKEQEKIVKMMYDSFETTVKALPIKMSIDIEIGNCWGENQKESKLEELFQNVGLN